ncbi:hypothetical protein NZK27_05630 [Synechococcus sp. FGCU-3]|nr:hypothetical protein [Synechococcus sp. FGCU3]
MPQNCANPTTNFTGVATVVVGANKFGGIGTPDLQRAAKEVEGATTFNYDLKLILDTSCTGKDLFRIRIRDGNFGSGPAVGPSQSAFFRIGRKLHLGRIATPIAMK